MPSSPTDRKYTTTHEWIIETINPDKSGITQRRVDQIGAVTEVELLVAENTNVTKGQTLANITGQNSDHVYKSPVNGFVTDRNETLLDHPEQVSEKPFSLDPQGGWIYEIKPDSSAEFDSLLTAAQYDSL